MKDKKTASLLLTYTKKHSFKLLFAISSTTASSFLNAVPPYLFKSVVDDVLISKNTIMLNTICISLVIIFIIKAITTYFQRYIMCQAGQLITNDIRLELYDHMQRMNLKKIYASRIGELMSRLTGDVSTLQGVVTNTIIDLLLNFITFIGMFAFILYLNWRLTLIIVLALPVTGYMLSFTSQKLRKAGHNVQEHLADITATAQEAFSAIRVVRSFATEDEELERFRQANTANYQALLQSVSIQALLAGAVEVFLITALSVVFWFGGNSVINGELTPGELVSFIGYIAFMVQPIRNILNNISNLQVGLASAERIYDIMQTPIEQTDTGINPGRLQGAVKFDDVYFSYEAGQEVLKGITLEVNAGEKIAIVGATGSGKSTLVDLIPRFYDPIAGRVLIDGYDVKELSLKELRRQIGIVPQECVLMRGSLAYNIAYGLNNPEMKRIIEASEIADIREFIESLPNKYETEVGERGVTLSGGQRQRIAIARAVIRNPRILILDEATSSLDIAVERQVQTAMNQAMKGRTSFIIAHRLTTVREADRILVLDGGKFVQSGTHEELMRIGGLYADLYNMQFGGE